MNEQAAETAMSDHIENFWKLLNTEHVRILIDIRKEHDCYVKGGVQYHWDSASFSDDVAKALVAQRGTSAVMVCGACGAIWQDGMSCGQKNNDHPFPVCFPTSRQP